MKVPKFKRKVEILWDFCLQSILFLGTFLPQRKKEKEKEKGERKKVKGKYQRVKSKRKKEKVEHSFE